MSDDITVTVQIAGGASAAQTYDLSDDAAAPPPPVGDGDLDVSFEADDPAPPPEADDDNNSDMSVGANQAKSTSAPPPDYDDDTEADVSDDEIDGPPPPEA